MRARHGKKRGSKIAAIEIARRQTEAIRHTLTTGQPFAPAGATDPLAARRPNKELRHRTKLQPNSSARPKTARER
jgi:hypothetical protein